MNPEMHFEFSLSTKDNIKLFGQGWKPKDKPKAVLCLIHGLGDHSGRYEHLARKFTGNGCLVASFDHRGNGKSEGKRGHSPSFSHYLSDLELFIKYIKTEFPDLQLILYGHSMGGNIALNYLMNNPATFVAGVVASPWIKLSVTPSLFKIALAKATKKILPALLQRTGIDSSHISRDMNEVKRYSEDIYNHDKISVATFVEVNNSGQWILENAEKLKVPIVLIHGDADKITSFEASENFAKKSKEFTNLRIYKGLYHEMHSEPEKNEIFNHIISKLEQLKFCN